MNRINLPDGCTMNDLVMALFAAGDFAAEAGRDNLAAERHRLAGDLDTVNHDDDAIGCVCDCAGRDPTEIAVYLKADELIALDWALRRITFGDLDDDVNPRHLHGAMKEIRDVGRDRAMP